MEVGRLTPGWFRILVGDTIDCTEIRGWRKTGRPQQPYQSFIELKTAKCIVHGSELEQIYKIGEMSKSSHVDKAAGLPSSIHRETMTSAITSKFSHSTTKDLLDQLPVASSSSSTTMASPWKKFTSFDVYLSYNDIITNQDFKHQLCNALVTAGILISPYSLNFLSGGGHLRTSEIRASIILLSENYANSVRCLDELLLVLDRRTKSNHYVLPLFYDVEASDVTKHQSLFQLRWYQQSDAWKAKVARWKAALTEVANLPGFSISRNNVTLVIEEIVSVVRLTLYPNAFSTPIHPTRQDTQAEDAK